ncbi:hypothetical protein HMN09_01014100 [Mycena chlorophos]|uniref:MIT domain-containing protein n=1 Tax=Mycena chlorophos TaxID=658473 RepID=A0A8H6W1A4_MYCCL|nr:hypothetical protein HMN09_01014100 [Mycena chlorophos]
MLAASPPSTSVLVDAPSSSLAAAAPEPRPHPRIPSTRRTLNRALALAQQAVQLDTDTEAGDPEAAITAYTRSVALLGAVIERIGRGEHHQSAEEDGRNQRLQHIHDTYAARLATLSHHHNIAPIPYSVSHEYSLMAVEAAAQRATLVSPISSAEAAQDLFGYDPEPSNAAHPYAAAASPSQQEDIPAPSHRPPRTSSLMPAQRIPAPLSLATASTGNLTNTIPETTHVAPTGRKRSTSVSGRRVSLMNGPASPRINDPLPPLPSVSQTALSPKANGLTVKTDLVPSSPGQNPSAPSLLPAPPTDPLRKPYHLMNRLRGTMTSPSGAYLTPRLHVPPQVWSQGGANLTNMAEKVRVVNILCAALEDLQLSSSEHFGAGNVSSGMALGIGSIGRREGEAWVRQLEEFLNVCDGVVASFGKKLGVGEGFVVKKTTWSEKFSRRIDKLTSGKNFDSPQTYVAGLVRLFDQVQLLDEHSTAITVSQKSQSAHNGLPQLTVLIRASNPTYSR